MKIKGIAFASLLVLVSTLIGLVLLEGAWFVWSKYRPRGKFDMSKRIMFFESRLPVFQNKGDIFFYTPHNTVRAKTIYFSETSYDTEYDYSFQTNNFGLVQDQDIASGKPSLLFLGDSFTEGQGAEPWFRLIVPHVERTGLQPINGGLIGTGFQQFWKLENFLTDKGFQIEKVAVIFISDDFRRPVRNFKEKILNCMNKVNPCDGTESFFPLPADDEIPLWVDRIRRLREGQELPRWAEILSTKAPATLQVYILLYNFVFPKPPDPALALNLKASETAIRALIAKYGARNVVFIHLPQKEEVGHRPSDLGLQSRKAIAAAGGSLFDGFQECNLSLSDYHLHDGHLNRAGYLKISSCVTKALSIIGCSDRP